MKQSYHIRVQRITPVKSGKSLKAFASVCIDDILIHDFRVVQQPNTDAWVSVPQKEVMLRTGRKYLPVIKLNSELKEAVSKAVLDAWNGLLNS